MNETNVLDTTEDLLKETSDVPEAASNIEEYIEVSTMAAPCTSQHKAGKIALTLSILGAIGYGVYKGGKYLYDKHKEKKELKKNSVDTSVVEEETKE